MAEMKKFLDAQGTQKVVDWAKGKFIQKEANKGLSEENFTAAYKEQMDNLVSTYATQADMTTKLAGKVDAVSGKTLTTNDFTTPEKQKLAGIASGANANVIETVKVNGTNQTVSGKAVDIKMPTKVSELTNDKGFATTEDVNNAVSKAGKLTKEIVTTLPTASSAKDNVIYMVKNSGGVSGDAYSEYMLVNGAMEKIGTTATEVDLSNYVTYDDVQGITKAELDEILK